MNTASPAPLFIECQNHKGDTNIAAVASLLADPTRATMLLALCDGRALPAGELARRARVAPSTASAHLAKLLESGFLSVESWGRHRYFRISSGELIHAIEVLAVVAPATEVRSLRQSQTATAVRFARTCYDHLAGALGVALTQALVEQQLLTEVDDGYSITPKGILDFQDFGLSLTGLKRQALFAPHHIDWSERRYHLAGRLAKALTRHLFELEWIVRTPSSRAVRLTEIGRKGLLKRFNLQL